MWHQGWNRVFQENQWGKYPSLEIIRFVARQFGSVENKGAIRILEIGCGTGANLIALANEGYDVYGIDGSEVALASLTEQIEESKTALTVAHGDAMSTHYADDFFDCVIDCECLYSNSIDDSVKILHEVKRVLKSTGTFLSITFMKDSPIIKNMKAEAFNNTLRQGCGDIRLMSEADVNALYGQFFTLSALDFSIRTDKDRGRTIGEWVVQCQKC